MAEQYEFAMARVLYVCQIEICIRLKSSDCNENFCTYCHFIYPTGTHHSNTAMALPAAWTLWSYRTMELRLPEGPETEICLSSNSI